jgi:hypothetical protein
MELVTRARVRRFESAEIGAVGAIVLAIVVQGFFVYRFVPVLDPLYANSGEGLSLRLRAYIGLYNWLLVLVSALPVAWIAFQIAGRPVPAAIRRRVLMVLAALAGPVTIAGLFFMAEDSLLQAMRLSSAVAASAQVRERDLSNLSLASGDPEQVIASLGPKVSRADFVTDVRWGAPGQAFQLAEAYRLKGDLPAARRFYLRAQQAAAGVDEVLTPRLMNRQARWQAQFGGDADFWLPNESEMKELSGRLRAVSQQRIDQLSK